MGRVLAVLVFLQVTLEYLVDQVVDQQVFRGLAVDQVVALTKRAETAALLLFGAGTCHDL